MLAPVLPPCGSWVVLHAHRFSRHSYGIPAVGVGQDGRFRVPGAGVGHQLNFRIEGVVPFDLLAGVGAKAAEDGGHGAAGGGLGFVVRLVVPNRFKQFVVLLLIGIFALLLVGIAPGLGAFD